MFITPVLMTAATLFWSPLFAHDIARGLSVLLAAALGALLISTVLAIVLGVCSCRFVIRCTLNKAGWIRVVLLMLCVAVSFGVAAVAFLPLFQTLCAAIEGNRTASAPGPRASPRLQLPPPFAEDRPTRPSIPRIEFHAINAARQAGRRLENGDFHDGLTGWNLEEAGDAFRVVCQDDQAMVTSYGPEKEVCQGRIYQCFTVPDAPTTLRFFVHGGRDAQALVVALWARGERIDRVTGKNDNEPFEVRWDLSNWKGQTVTLEIRDEKQGPWGFIGAHGFELLLQEETNENQ